jgi:hypothetical protein
LTAGQLRHPRKSFARDQTSNFTTRRRKQTRRGVRASEGWLAMNRADCCLGECDATTRQRPLPGTRYPGGSTLYREALPFRTGGLPLPDARFSPSRLDSDRKFAKDSQIRGPACRWFGARWLRPYMEVCGAELARRRIERRHGCSERSSPTCNAQSNACSLGLLFLPTTLRELISKSWCCQPPPIGHWRISSATLATRVSNL